MITNDERSLVFINADRMDEMRDGASNPEVTEAWLNECCDEITALRALLLAALNDGFDERLARRFRDKLRESGHLPPHLGPMSEAVKRG